MVHSWTSNTQHQIHPTCKKGTQESWDALRKITSITWKAKGLHIHQYCIWEHFEEMISNNIARLTYLGLSEPIIWFYIVPKICTHLNLLTLTIRMVTKEQEIQPLQIKNFMPWCNLQEVGSKICIQEVDTCYRDSIGEINR